MTPFRLFTPSLLFVPLLFVSCHEPDAGIERIVVEEDQAASAQETAKADEALEDRLARLEEELLAERNAHFKRETEQRALLAEMKGMLRALREDGGQRKAQTARMTEEEFPKAAHEKVDPKVREAARLAAQGEKVATLTTRTGERFQDLVIVRVNDIGVIFRHRSGVARVPFAELPLSWGERFYFDPERARVAEQAEREAQQRRDQEIARQMRQRQAQEADAQEEREAAEARLTQLAVAVEELRRRDRDDEQGVFLNGFGNGGFGRVLLTTPQLVPSSGLGFFAAGNCPPLVRPALACPPLDRTPLVRTSLFDRPGGQRPTGGQDAAAPNKVRITPRQRTSGANERILKPALQRVRPAAPPVIRPTPSPASGTSKVRSRARPSVSRPRVPKGMVRPSTRSRPSPSPMVIRKRR